MRWKLKAGPVAVPQKEHVKAFSFSRRGDARPSTALQSDWHRGHGRKTFGKSTAPSLKRGKTMCLYCV